MNGQGVMPGPLDYGLRRQSEVATALWLHRAMLLSPVKGSNSEPTAPSPLRSAGAVHTLPKPADHLVLARFPRFKSARADTATASVNQRRTGGCLRPFSPWP